MVNEKYFYRIQNAFEGHQDCFWYVIHSEGTELNSHCTDKKEAPVYDGKTINKHIAMIKGYKNAKLLEI